MEQQYDPAALEAAYCALASGEPRMRAIRAAASSAEQNGDTENALHFHHTLIRESVFSGDRFQALIDFPQYLTLVHSDPALEREWAHTSLWLFKWIVEASTEFYQIEKKQVLAWFSEFRRELSKQGYSLKPFYEKRAIFFYYCDRARLYMDYADFLDAPMDEMCDGEADELNTAVRWELEFGSREKGLRTAEKIISKNMQSDEIPATTYGYLLRDAVRHGETERAAEYAQKLRGLCSGARFRLEQTGLLLEYDAKTDPARGYRFYLSNQNLRENLRNPLLCFRFDCGAAVLLRAAADAGVTDDPDALREAAAQYRLQAQSAAEKFDARNGSDFFASALHGALEGV